MQSVVLQHDLCPGDITVMTVIPRELYRHARGRFRVFVQTPFPGLWENNPFIAGHISIGGQVPPNAVVVKAAYSPSKDSPGGVHFIQSYLMRTTLAMRAAGLDVPDLHMTELRPYIRLTEQEKALRPSKKGKLQGLPYWVVHPGGKYDVTTKWWDPAKWQDVVHKLSGNPDFPVVAQAGKSGVQQHQPILRDCVNLVDHTKTLRQLLWLIYHSRGVICGVTSLMHMAAALRKPCVVVAGGREAWWWDSYDQRAIDRHTSAIPEKFRKTSDLLVPHVYLDTLGRLPCCKEKGCWKKGLGEAKKGENCTRIQKPRRYQKMFSMPQPECMRLIEPDTVVKAALTYEGLA